MITRPIRLGLAALLAALGIAAAPMRTASPDPAAYVNFSFDQVDIRTFVRLVGEVTGQAFVVDQGVDGKVSIVTPPIPAARVFPLFVAVLESSGCAVVKEEGFYRVAPLPPRGVASAPVVGAGEEAPAGGLITKVIHLEHVAAGDIRRALEPKVGGGKSGALTAVELTNHLIITDTADSVRKIEKILAEIDKPGMTRTTEVVPLLHAGAEEVAQQLAVATATGERTGEQLARRLPRVGDSGEDKARSVAVVPAPHANSLILVGTPAEVSELKDLVKLLDVATQAGSGRLHAISLQYLTADEAAKSLNGLLDKTMEKKADQVIGARRISIEASVANNALLVEATPRDFELVRELVTALDQKPQQVLIEVMIAEISQTDSLDIGVELAALDLPSKVGDSVIQGSTSVDDAPGLLNAIQSGIFPRGLTVGIAHGSSLDSSGKVVPSYPAALSINAVRKDSRFKILSNIPLLAQNNKEATASVVQNIPILKSTIQGGSGTSRDVIQNIDRVDVGIKLKLTPHVNPDGNVRLTLNPSIEAIIDPGPAGTQFTPTIARREVSTTVNVPDGRTIIISGLIREDQTKVVRRIPWLGSLPVIGWLFRHTVDAKERTNLMVFVTPHVVSKPGEAEAITKTWETATGLSSTNTASPPPK